MSKLTDSHYAEKVNHLLRYFNYPIDVKIINFSAYFEALKHDKKNRDGSIKFILQRNLADTFISELSEEIIKESVM